MHCSKAARMNTLQLIKSGVKIPSNEKYDFILLDLADDGMISVNGLSDITLTNFGLKSLDEWDPILEVSVNYQLVQQPYGEA